MEQKVLHCFIDGVGLAKNDKSRTTDAKGTASYDISIKCQAIPLQLESVSNCIAMNTDSHSFLSSIVNKYHSESTYEYCLDTVGEIRSAHDFANSYILGDMIGGGGDGTVYTAHAINTRSPLRIVIKKIAISMNREYNIYDKVSQSLQELQCLRRTKIATLHSIYYDHEEGAIYKVYDRLDANLSQIMFKLNRNKLTLTECQTRRILMSLCRKVKKLHMHGYIHGDIKPDNILFAARDKSSCEWSLIDFDRIKYCGASASHQIYSTFCGTFGFTAPELVYHGGILMNVLDDGVDIWALGLMMIWCLNGGDLGCMEVNACRRDRYNAAAKHGDIDVMTALFNEYYSSIFCYNTTPLYIVEIERLYEENKICIDLYDLLNKMLVFEPEKRLKMEDILMHEWFQTEDDDDMVLIKGKEMNLYSALIDVNTEHMAMNVQKKKLNALHDVVYNELLDGSTAYDDYDAVENNNKFVSLSSVFGDANASSEYMVDELDLLNGSTSYDHDADEEF